MIPAVAQTLAEILAEGTSLISTEHIDFNHPGAQQDVKPRLNLYCYDLRRNSQREASSQSLECRMSQKIAQTLGDYTLQWFDVSFLVSAWDRTVLGEQRLLSEALISLLRYRLLQEEQVAPVLRGYGNLPIDVSTVQPHEMATLWHALGVPLRPALCVTVTIPLNLQQAVSSDPDSPLQREFVNPNQIGRCW